MRVTEVSVIPVVALNLSLRFMIHEVVFPHSFFCTHNHVEVSTSSIVVMPIRHDENTSINRIFGTKGTHGMWGNERQPS